MNNHNWCRHKIINIAICHRKIWVILIAVNFFNVICSTKIHDVNTPNGDGDDGDIFNLDPSRYILHGPGFEKPELVFPARYFFVQLVDKQGRNVTKSPTDEHHIEAAISGPKMGSETERCEIRMRIINRYDGVFTIQYRLFETCEFLKLELRTSDKKIPIAKSPYYLGGKMPILQEECECPRMSIGKFIDEMDCPKKYKQVERDLKYWPPKSVNYSKVLEEANERWFQYPKNYLPCHYVVADNQLYRQCYGNFEKFGIYVEYIMLSLLRKIRLPDTEFIINLADWPLETKNLTEGPLPVFGWSTSDGTFDITLPTYEMIARTFEALGKVAYTCGPERVPDLQAAEAMNYIPWDRKIAKAFYRGRDSNRARFRLVELSRSRPDLLDAGITYFFRFKDEQDVYGPVVDQVPFQEYFKYKYLVNVDGFVAAYRLAHLLMGNSLVFKQESPYYEHYYKALKPWKHYVPVERDLSDLLEKIEWAKANDEEAQRIVKRANRFVQKHLYPKDIFCYHAVAFRDYTKLLMDRPQIPPKTSNYVHLAQPKSDCPCDQKSKYTTKTPRQEL